MHIFWARELLMEGESQRREVAMNQTKEKKKGERSEAEKRKIKTLKLFMEENKFIDPIFDFEILK